MLYQMKIWSSARSIYKVPHTLCGADRDAYSPIYLTMGCYNTSVLAPSFKIKYLNPFLGQAKQIGLDLFSLLKIIMENSTKIRELYADLSHDESSVQTHWDVERDQYRFAQSVLVDTAFLIELFRRHKYPPSSSQHDQDPHLSTQVLTRINYILRDIFLLENQLPLFIIKQLYSLVYESGPPLTHIFCEFLGLKDRIKVSDADEGGCHHLLDLMRSYYSPSNGIIIDIDYRKRRYVVSPTATALYEAGVKFKVLHLDDGDHSRLLDIHFNQTKGILTIPKLSTEDPTLCLLKNMMAFEQCMQSSRSSSTTIKAYITDYLYFLDCLINTPRDVELLADAGIVENCLGCEAVCDMFNATSKNTKIDWQSYTYGGLSEQLIVHCKYSWNRHKATLKNKYFGHPWAMVSVIYAVILLVLTVIQVTTGILAVPGVLK